MQTDVNDQQTEKAELPIHDVENQRQMSESKDSCSDNDSQIAETELTEECKTMPRMNKKKRLNSPYMAVENHVQKARTTTERLLAEKGDEASDVNRYVDHEHLQNAEAPIRDS
jgi:23S rRNA G2069 N7-methylase RlmK/C1962 C5-methylase RlmI